MTKAQYEEMQKNEREKYFDGKVQEVQHRNDV